MTAPAETEETAIAAIRAFEVVCAFPDGISKYELKVNCSRRNDRQQSTVENEKNIDTIWKHRTASNSSLFNGTKFRFENILDASRTPVLNLGITDYKSFLGTNCAPNWEQLDPTTMASPLGNAAIVETEDEKVVLLKRSGSVGEMPHTVVMPGGHPEPEMIGIKTLEYRKGMRTDAGTKGHDQGLNDNIRDELWDSMIREVVEETGIPREALGKTLCIGFTRRVQNHRPDIIFFVECTLSADEVRRLYANGPEHKSESTDLITVDRMEFITQVIKEDSIHMPGCHRGGVELYRQFVRL